MIVNPPELQVVTSERDSGLPGPELSIVIPLFNEAPMLSELFTRLETVVASLSNPTEVILIDDGSSDSTWLDITHYVPHSFTCRNIALSRNFGKEAALTAGLHAESIPATPCTTCMIDPTRRSTIPKVRR
jgi:glycosyltransferase involved in cell wall biosynthesis